MCSALVHCLHWNQSDTATIGVKWSLHQKIVTYNPGLNAVVSCVVHCQIKDASIPSLSNWRDPSHFRCQAKRLCFREQRSDLPHTGADNWGARLISWKRDRGCPQLKKSCRTLPRSGGGNGHQPSSQPLPKTILSAVLAKRSWIQDLVQTAKMVLFWSFFYTTVLFLNKSPFLSRNV